MHFCIASGEIPDCQCVSDVTAYVQVIYGVESLKLLDLGKIQPKHEGVNSFDLNMTKQNLALQTETKYFCMLD